MRENRPHHGRRGKWKAPAGDERDGLWRKGHGKIPKTKGRGRQVKEVHRVLPDREEVVRESVDKDAM